MTRKSAAPTYLREATLTYRTVRGAPRDLFPDKPITSSEDVDRLLRPMLAGCITESLVVLVGVAVVTLPVFPGPLHRAEMICRHSARVLCAVRRTALPT